MFVGMLIGGALPWLFSSFAIQAVTRAASLIVLEVRRQFKLGVLEGKVKPDYKQAVEISTTAAQKELVSLALLGIVTPIVVGLTLQVEALGGFLAGIIVSGQLLAVFLNNSGGAWDNAKKLIEDEPRRSEEESRQRLRTSQGWRGGRYGRRSLQGYRRSCAQPDDQSREPCLRSSLPRSLFNTKVRLAAVLLLSGSFHLHCWACLPGRLFNRRSRRSPWWR